MQHISIYDFDKTITRRATFLPFLFFGLRHYRPWRSVTLPLLLLATLGFGVRAIDRGRLKELAFRLVYGHFVDEMALRENAQGFAERTWATNMFRVR